MRDARPLTRHLAVFSTAHAIGILAPLLTTPYLARVLGPAGWGPVVLAQGIVGLVALLPEYGFDLTGTRALATSDDPARRGRQVADVFAARLLLLPIAGGLLLAIAAGLPLLRADLPLIGWSVLAMWARGASPLWVFQGLGDPEGAVAIEVTGRLVAALAVFVVVHQAGDGWRVLALQGVTGALTALVLMWRTRRLLPVGAPSLAGARRALRDGWSVFAFRGASALYMQANIVVVGAVAAPAAVAMYGGAERVVRAGINLFAPLTNALFPRAARAMPAGPDAQRDSLAETTRWIGGLGLVTSLLCLVAARPLVLLLLGPAFTEAIPLLRGLAALPTLIAIGTVLGIHWAIPHGHARPFLRLVLAAGAISLVSATLLIPRIGAWGMVIGATAAEGWVAAGLLLLYRRQRAVA